MINTHLEEELNIIRLEGHSTPETYNGMAIIFSDAPSSESIGIFTLSFAERWCRDNPEWSYRKI